MAFHLLLLFVLLNIAFGGSHATLTKEELYWKSVFPHTPMPRVLQQILPTPGQSISFKDAKSGANQNKGANDDQFGLYFVGDSSEQESKNEASPNDPEFGAYAYDSNYNDHHANKGVNDDQFGLYFVGDSSEEEARNKDSTQKKSVNDDHFGLYFVGDSSEEEPRNKDSTRKKSVNDDRFGVYFVGDSSEEEPRNKDSTQKKSINDDQFGLYFVGDSSEQESNNEVSPNDPEFGAYGYDSKYINDPTNKANRKALRGKSSHEDTNNIKETIYFFQENLLPGTKVNLPRLLTKSDMAMFLPQQIAESMPLSNEKLPQILKNFSLIAESRGANDVKVAVRNCERSGMKGEKKYCTTSLESFVDLGVSMLGKNIKLLSHELGKDMKSPIFTIGQGVRKMGENNIVCHKMKYPYALYLCHSIEKTEIYKVPLVSKDGTKAKAMAACHKDTSAWSPNHFAMKLLKVKPGTVPICHFLGRDTLVWILY